MLQHHKGEMRGKAKASRSDLIYCQRKWRWQVRQPIVG
jgi:hypothetical protein